MRLRTTIGLATRAIGATAIGFGALAVIGLGVAAIGGVVLGSMLLIAAEQVIDADSVFVQIYASATLLSVLLFGLVVRQAFRDSRRHLFRETEPIDADSSERLVAATTQLATIFDIESPEIRLRETDTPLAYTMSWTGDPVLVVSTGLFETLTDDEAEAVLAHELAHLANGDLRLMSWVLVPLVAAEEFYAPMADGNTDPRVLPWLAIGRVGTASAKLGVGLFSRGREFAADRAAAVATGEPAALASALERLDESSPRQPSADLRKHAGSVDALSVLPTLDPERDAGGGLAATHPATERRIDRLRRLATD